MVTSICLSPSQPTGELIYSEHFFSIKFKMKMKLKPMLMKDTENVKDDKKGKQSQCLIFFLKINIKKCFI